MTIFKKTPSILAFQRCLTVTDGLLFSKNANGEVAPISIYKHGIRGTQNPNPDSQKDAATSSSKSAKIVDPRNLQVIDSARTQSDAVSTIIEFSIKFISINESLFAVAPDKDDNKGNVTLFSNSVADFISRANGSQGLLDVACRFARNIANARWTWRNRTYASNIVTTVTVSDLQGQIVSTKQFDSLSISMKDFDNLSDDEIEVGQYISDSLSGNGVYVLTVSAEINFGITGSYEVYPSQLFVSGEKEKCLYQTMNGQAAFRDQKISNAIKTIDTWYPSFDTLLTPISVEPCGANLTFNELLRPKGTTSFEYLRKLDELDVDSDEGKFMIACLIRGGVYPTAKATGTGTGASGDDADTAGE